MVEWFYKFEEGIVLRDEDTISKVGFKKEFFFLGEQVSLGNIDAIKLSTTNNNQLFIYKENDSYSYLNGN